MYKMEQAARIQSLMEDNSQLKRTIANGGLTTPPPTLYPASLQVGVSTWIQFLTATEILIVSLTHWTDGSSTYRVCCHCQ